MEKTSTLSNDLNISIFKFFNESFGKPEFDGIMNFSARYGGHDLFPYYLLLIFIIASFAIYSNNHDIKTMKKITISWLSSGVTLFFSLAIGFAFFTNLIKNYTSVTRPYCSMDDIYSLSSVTYELACSMSFPSGHTAFSTIMIASFWNLLNRYFKVISIIFITIVAISRMASGAHYPIDILGAIAITLPLTLYIHHKVSIFIKKHENKMDIFNGIFNKIKK
jgi:membrane-associated phospholipid phosphatase